MTRKLQFVALLLAVAAAGWLWWSSTREGVQVTPSMPGAPTPAAPIEPAPAVESVDPVDEPREVAAARSIEAAPVGAQATETLLRVQVLAREDLVPVAGVRLMLRRTDGEKEEGCSNVKHSRAAFGECPLTDQAGWAEFECASGIPYAVSSSGLEIEWAKLEAPPLAPGERRELQLLVRTQDDLTLFGVLLDGETKSPVPGGELRSESGRLNLRSAGSSDDAPTRRADVLPLARADAEGRFELRGASWRSTFARATAPGCAPTVFRIAEGHSDAANPLQVLLWRAGALDVRVAKSAGEPVADMLVDLSTDYHYLRQDDGSREVYRGEEPRWSAKTDAQGRASVEGLMPRAPLKVITRAPNADPRAEAQPVTLAPGERRALEIRLGTGAAVQGRVIDDRSQPVADRIIWRVAARRPAGQTMLFQRSDKPAATTRTDAQGAFRFDDVPAGVWSVGLAPTQVDPRDPRRFPAFAETVDVEGAEANLELLLLVHPDLFLRGSVVDPDGKPVVRCRVRATRSGASMFPDASSDEAGAFELGPLPAGAWEITAGFFGTHFAPSLPVTAEAGTGGLVLAMRPGASIAGRIVKDGSSGSLECETILTQVDPPFHRYLKRSSGGNFEFKGLLPGTYVVLARESGGWIGVTPQIRLESGQQELEREVELQAGAVLALRYDGGKEFLDVELFVGGQRLETAQVSPGRRMEKTVLPGTLEARWRVGETPKSCTVVLAAGETKEVVLDDRP